MFKKFAVVVAAVALVMMVGCAKVPEQEIQSANSAMNAAKTAEAQLYAPAAYKAAMDTLNGAMAAKQEADGKFVLFRSYGKTKQALASAERLANEAVAKAQAEKERVKQEVMAMMTEAKAVLDSADVAIKKAPRGKGSKADIELMKNDLAAAVATYGEAEADFNGGKYLAAKGKLEAAMQKARMVMDQIAQARAGKKMTPP